MLSLLVAAISSLLWGVSDVLGGESARRIGVLRATLLSYLSGAVVLLVLLAVTLPRVDGTGIAFGAAAGAATLIGFVAFYAAMAAGAMGVVAAGTALLQAIVPVLVGLLVLRDRVGPGAWIGLALALPASVLLALDDSQRRMPARAVIATIVAGIAFGVAVVILDAAPVDAGLVPATGEIVLGLIVLAAIWASGRASAAVRRGAAMLDPGTAAAEPARRRPVALALGSGVAMGLGNATLIAALHLGQLTLVAVVLSLYPAATAVLARVLFRERLRPRQVTGIALALAAGVALAVPA